MRVAFRLSASKTIGFGHLRRCLSLAEALTGIGVDSRFLVDGDDAAAETISRAGYLAHLASVADEPECSLEFLEQSGTRVLVVDSYDLPTDYLRSVGAAGVYLVAIDDLADRALFVDVVVNSSPAAEKLYKRRDPNRTYLLGPGYALLRAEFGWNPEPVTREKVERVLITMGGSDPLDLTVSAVSAAISALGDVAVDVVVGPLAANEDRIQIQARIATGLISIHRDPLSMRELMLAADLAICGAGQTLYELAACGTPAVAIQVADNQELNYAEFGRAGTMSPGGVCNSPDLAVSVERALCGLQDRSVRAAMHQRGRALVDGQGSWRVATAVATRLTEGAR